MLTGAFIFLVIAIISGYIRFKGTNPASIFPAKIIFYVSTLIFLILLLFYFFYPAPPVAQEVINPLLQ
ncbi:Small integral membrane protein [Legionella steigerwaltii]|uniref:Small integral membrane protein n=1 Tax=Legionella steigerwaltii TaxID=460 RepID=A0A378LAJ3_9GAMM|nr:DUF1328 family protein [Legionella steigerwaltii]KTD71675.1 hypothetical protein Lstg_2883 [Legionella steigerwaltii]STY23843.1 Small integral membrane protein [Legionella steigerwaltii]